MNSRRSPRPLSVLRVVLVLVAALAAGCGKKGAPLAPLYLVPSSVGEVSARRVDNGVRLRFMLPAKNENGPGIDLDRVEIYAVTVAPGGETPPNRELLTKTYLAGRIEVKPVPAEGEAPTTAAADSRPSPGDTVTFVEQLTPKALEPLAPKPVAKKPAPPAPSRQSAPGGDAQPTLPVVPLQPQPGWPAAAAPAAVSHPVRVYVVRGVARNGRSGPPSARIPVPLGAVPDAPGGLTVRNTETAVVAEWLPGLATVGGGLLRYNVYEADAASEPVNRNPLEAPSYERAGAAQGTEVCFRVRAVDVSGSVHVESGPSNPACLTPKDVFPPAAPKGLAAVATPGAVQLIWDANSEADFAGYIVLRAEAPGETLQPLTPAPIRDTVFQDTTVKPGVRYVYAIVAVDSATPPNRSAESERAEATAR
jgi:predicted small lipoprotein YifL